MTINVTRPSMPPLDEYIEEIRDIWESQMLTNMGPKHNKLRDKLVEYLDVENVELMVNGHMSLELTIQAMNLSGEVITTPFTFASTIHAIVRNGLTPVFCDINSRDYTIDVNKIESLITDKTSAIIPVHVYGNICDIDAIDIIARKHKLKVIYDAAHTFGERYKGRGVGRFGDASCFSFHATKVFNTIEGGAVCYSDKEFGKALYNLKNFGIRGPEHVVDCGANAKMNELCASMGLCNLRHIDKDIALRKKVVDRYVKNLSGNDGIILNSINIDTEYNYAYFPVLIESSKLGKSRDEIDEELRLNGIIARKYFYPIASEYECYRDKYDATKTPIALDVSKKILTLPLYANLSNEEVDKICQIILK